MRGLITTGLFSLLFLIPTTGNASIVFKATLSGAQEVPANSSTATGFATFVLNDTLTALTVDVTVFGLDFGALPAFGTPQTPSTADDLVNAHIHAGTGTGVGSGLPGFNAGVRWGFIGMPFNDLNQLAGSVVPFASGVGGTFSSTWDLNEGNGTTLAEQLPNILAGRSYINFHTTTFPGGEIRGQLQAVPEPSTFTVFAIGAVGFAAGRFRKRRAA